MNGDYSKCSDDWFIVVFVRSNTLMSCDFCL